MTTPFAVPDKIFGLTLSSILSTAAHTALALDSATGGGQARGPPSALRAATSLPEGGFDRNDGGMGRLWGAVCAAKFNNFFTKNDWIFAPFVV